jgi:hypothetical protein
MNSSYGRITALCLIGIVSLFISCSSASKPAGAEYSIPFTLENNRIVLNAVIDGFPGKYFFDTGCEGIITNTRIATLKETPPPYDRMYMLGSVKRYKAYSLDSIQIGETTVPVSTFVLGSDVKIVGFDGIIGLSVFKGYFVELSFSKRRINLYKAEPKGYRRQIPIYFDTQSHPYLDCEIDGMKVPFLIDTGSPINIVFPLPYANCVSRDKYQRIISYNESYESYRVNIDRYDDGFRVFTRITGNSNPLSTLDNGTIFMSYGNLGLDYLKHLDLVIDNRGSAVTYLRYRNRSFIADLYPGRKGIWFLCGRMNAQYNDLGIDGWQKDGERYVISSVLEKGKAISAGIRPGTEIVKINGRSTGRYNARKITDLLLFDKSRLRLECVIDGTERTIELK